MAWFLKAGTPGKDGDPAKTDGDTDSTDRKPCSPYLKLPLRRYEDVAAGRKRSGDTEKGHEDDAAPVDRNTPRGTTFMLSAPIPASPAAP